MDWIKVTPETMPPDMEPVIATIQDKRDGERETCSDVRYNSECKKWEVLMECYTGYWDEFGEFIEVTHWMPYPEPAED